MGKHKGRHKTPTQFLAGIPVREIRPGYWLADYQIDGHRTRKCFGDLADARLYCEQRRIELRNRGTAALSLTDALRADATAAAKVLEPLGVTLLHAAQEYARRHPATAVETFRETCNRYLVEMRKAGRRELSIADKQGKMDRLCDRLGDLPTAGVDTVDVQQWIEARGYTNGTARAYLGAAKTILAFYRGEHRQRQTADETPPVTWGPEIVERVMRAAEAQATDLVPALAILFFAGLRPDETKRLTWDRIDLVAREINLDGTITKTRTMRHVHIEDNLVSWLRTYPGSGQVVPSAGRFRGQREKVMRAAGLDGWPTDVARHTFATALYRTIGDAGKVMAELGHFGDAGTFTRHYKGVPMTAAEASFYWNIEPVVS